MKIFRRSQVRFILLVALLGLGAQTAKAAPLNIMDFRGGVFFAASGSEDFAPSIAWTPSVSAGVIGFRGELGAGYFLDAGNLFTNYEAFVQVSILPMLGIEGGAGFITTHVTGGSTQFLWSVQATISLVGPINNIYFGYSSVDGGGDLLRAGIGFSL